MGSVKVQSGEIISSKLMNSILERLGNLEPGGVGSLVQITGFDPPEQVEEKKNLVIHGTNFLYPPERNTVLFDMKAATTILEGSSCRLNVRVPDMTLPSGGKNVTVIVKNDLGEATAVFRILREMPPVGDPPIIEKVTHVTGEMPLTLGQSARIVGNNFAKKPDENIVKLGIVPPLITLPGRRPGTPVVYPIHGSLKIAADSKTPEELVVALPTKKEIEKNTSLSNLPGKVKAQFGVIVGDHSPAISDEVEIKTK